MNLITALIVIGLTILVNIIGWVYGYGKLTQRVKSLNEDNHKIMEQLGDLDNKVYGISRNLAALEGTVKTFMDFIRKSDGKRKESNS